jgi:hypothetical protein
MIIAGLYTFDILIEPINDYTNYLLTEIWIRPTITYSMVACFVAEMEEYGMKSAETEVKNNNENNSL